jgi:outer membrane lipoprotein-sorting protein
MRQSHLAMYYAANDGSAQVHMRIVSSSGKEREREFTMLRLDAEDGGKQYYYTYFNKPSDVSRMTFMVHKDPFESDQRWLFVPAVDLVKRISADDKASSFVGSDFTYEEVSGRHWTEDTHTLRDSGAVNDHPVYIVESVPKKPYGGFAKKISFIDNENKLPLKEEYYDEKGILKRVFTAEKIETIQDIPTATERKMTLPAENRYTIVSFQSVAYNVGLSDDIFTERYLRTPPRQFIK